MYKTFSAGSVRPHKGWWYAYLRWSDGAANGRISKNTGIEAKGASPKGRARAEKVLKDWRDQLVAEEELSQTSISHTPTAEYFREYLRTKGSLAPSTFEGYESYVKKIAAHRIGGIPLCAVGPRDIEEWVSHLRDKVGYSPASLSKAYVFVKQVFSYAVKMGDLAANPAAAVEAPKRSRKPVNSLTTEGLRKLDGAIESMSHADSLYIAIKIALFTGMREGEICALRWCDVDLGAKVLHVTHNMQKAKGTYRLADPKTPASRRWIPLGETLHALLSARKEYMQAEAEAFGCPWSEQAYVLGSAITMKWKSPGVLQHEWKALAKIAGITGTLGEHLRFHDLRHSFATHAIASGQDVKTVSALLGHTNAAMTLDIYADALPESKRESMDDLDRYFSGRPDDGKSHSPKPGRVIPFPNAV